MESCNSWEIFQSIKKSLSQKKTLRSLFKIIQTNDTGGFQLILNQAAGPNTTDQSGKTALMMAVELEYVQWVELLMEHEANTNQQNHIGTTALLLLASHQSHSNVVRTLIAINAKINVKSCVF